MQAARQHHLPLLRVAMQVGADKGHVLWQAVWGPNNPFPSSRQLRSSASHNY